jgi:hypothetical protein
MHIFNDTILKKTRNGGSIVLNKKMIKKLNNEVYRPLRVERLGGMINFNKNVNKKSDNDENIKFVY